MVVNMIGGKSWKIDDYFVGFFASINNILDQKYRTGGFEQGRNANYQQLLQDTNKPKRVFGPKYWYCLLYTSPSPRDRTRSRMPSSA